MSKLRAGPGVIEINGRQRCIGGDGLPGGGFVGAQALTAELGMDEA
jgi:hypothetical protein